MPTALTLAIYALAVARVTRLITEDRIFDRPRNAALAALPDDHQAAYLLLCPWCVSVWVAIPAAVIAYWWGEHPAFLVPAIALAFSHITGVLTAGGN